ncbi:MAG: exopolysaccharide biosynthesis polyprenyl glycosylphosphotransferase [Brevinema sp.]
MKNIPFYQFFKCSFLVFSDMIGFYLALFLALYIRSFLPKILPIFIFPLFKTDLYFTIELFSIFIILVIVFVMLHLYQKRRTFWEELLVIWEGLFIGFLLSSLFLFNFQYILPFMSRTVLFILFLIMMLTIPIIRYIFKWALYQIHFWQAPVVFACAKGQLKRAIRIAKTFANDPYLGFQPVAFYSEDDLGDSIQFNSNTLPLLKKISELPKNGTIFVVTELLDHQDPIIVSLYSIYRKVFIIPLNAVGLIGSGAQYLFSERIFIIPLENKLNSMIAKILKNTMDYIIGFFIVLVISPIFLITALLIKITSKGSIFYCQERIGKGGKPFKIWKFRSMHVNADQRLQELLAKNPELKKQWDTYFKLDQDPRITPVGHFLRKYSIDELPQLFNVLLGSMSLVGPRPFVKGEIEEINPSLVSLYAQVKPGLTGLWQISGRNETSRQERLQIDVWYLQNWSPSLDFLIFLNTPIAVITARGAR